MNASDLLQDRANGLVEAARAFHASVEGPDSHVAAPEVLESLAEALQVLSGAWYQLAADASPGIVARRRERTADAPSWPRVEGRSREQEVRLIGTLHDVAAAFARCARACRDAQSLATPIIVRGASPADRRQGNRLPHFDRYQRPTERVA